MSMFHRTTVASMFVLWCITIGFLNSAIAQDVDKSSTLPAVKLVEGSEALVQSTYKLWEESYQLMEQGEELAKKNPKLPKIAKAWGKSLVLSNQVQRAAGHLVLLGEPAGVDLGIRGLAIENKLIHFRDVQYKQIGLALQPLAKQEFQRNGTRIGKTIRQIRDLIGEENYEEAEKAVFKLYDDVNGYGFFLHPNEGKRLYPQFNSTVNATRVMAEVRRATYTEMLTKKVNTLTVGSGEYQKNISSEVERFFQSNSAKEDGQTGPKFLQSLLEKINKRYVDLSRAKAITALFRDAPLREKVVKYVGSVKEFRDKIILKLLSQEQLVSSAKDAKTIHTEYLSVLPKILIEHAENGAIDQRLIQNCRQSLTKIVKKNDAYADRVGAYRDATNELLYWRKSVAAENRIAASAGTAPVSALLRDNVDRRTKHRTLGTLNMKEDHAVPSNLRAGLHLTYPGIQKSLVGKHAIFDGLSYRGKIGFVSMVDRYWARSDEALDLAPHVQRLKQDLMITDSQPPLTIESAVVLASAARPFIAHADCEIVEVKIESLIDRIVNLPEKANFMLPAGRNLGDFDIGQMVLRIKLKPRWVQHSHFFADLRRSELVGTQEAANTASD